MALNTSSKQVAIKLGPHKGEEMYVMNVNLYNTVDIEKIIRYASETCGIPKAALRQAWEALVDVITESYIILCKPITPTKEIKDTVFKI